MNFICEASPAPLPEGVLGGFVLRLAETKPKW